MSDITTLNQVVRNLREIADKHLQIRNFKFGQLSNFTSSGVANCTEMWVEPMTAPVTRNTIAFNFRMWILDGVKRGLVNETEVLSDTTQIAQDVIAQLRHPDYGWLLDFKDTNVLNYVFEESDYKWTGVYFDFNIQLKYPADRCAAVFSSSPIIYP